MSEVFRRKVRRRARVEVGKEVEESFSPSKSWRVGFILEGAQLEAGVLVVIVGRGGGGALAEG